MRKIKARNQSTFPGMESWQGSLSPKKVKLLKKTWAGTFQTHILPKLPVERFSKEYSSSMGRPTKELYTVMGVALLQQFFNLTDERTLEELAFNQQWHFALDNYDVEDHVVSEKTLWTVRNLLAKTNMGHEIFTITVDYLIQYFNVDTRLQRMDSVHVHSNMARLGRVRLMARVVSKFLTNLRRHDKALFNALAPRFNERYLLKKSGQHFSDVKPTDTQVRLKDIADDLYDLITLFKANKSAKKLYSFGLMERVFKEQCTVDTENQVVVVDNKQVPSNSLQNPSDVDASYDGHKGQGYQIQIMETHSEKAKSPDDEPRLDLITYVNVEPAHGHDSKAVQPALSDVSQRGISPEELTADTLYGSEDNIEKAKGVATELIAPTPGKGSSKGYTDFELNEEDDIVSCPSGKAPEKIKKNKRKGSWTALWKKSVCEACPLLEQCIVKKGKRFYRLQYLKRDIKIWKRRKHEESEVFKNKYNMRAGIEASISRVIHQTGARRLRYRGLARMSFGETMKVLAINMFRTTKYRMRCEQLSLQVG